MHKYFFGAEIDENNLKLYLTNAHLYQFKEIPEAFETKIDDLNLKI